MQGYTIDLRSIEGERVSSTRLRVQYREVSGVKPVAARGAMGEGAVQAQVRSGATIHRSCLPLARCSNAPCRRKLSE